MRSHSHFLRVSFSVLVCESLTVQHIYLCVFPAPTRYIAGHFNVGQIDARRTSSDDEGGHGRGQWAPPRASGLPLQPPFALREAILLETQAQGRSADSGCGSGRDSHGAPGNDDGSGSSGSASADSDDAGSDNAGSASVENDDAGSASVDNEDAGSANADNATVSCDSVGIDDRIIGNDVAVGRSSVRNNFRTPACLTHYSDTAIRVALAPPRVPLSLCADGSGALREGDALAAFLRLAASNLKECNAALLTAETAPTEDGLNEGVVRGVLKERQGLSCEAGCLPDKRKGATGTTADGCVPPSSPPAFPLLSWEWKGTVDCLWSSLMPTAESLLGVAASAATVADAVSHAMRRCELLFLSLCLSFFLSISWLDKSVMAHIDLGTSLYRLSFTIFLTFYLSQNSMLKVTRWMARLAGTSPSTTTREMTGLPSF